MKQRIYAAVIIIAMVFTTCQSLAYAGALDVQKGIDKGELWIATHNLEKAGIRLEEDGLIPAEERPMERMEMANHLLYGWLYGIYGENNIPDANGQSMNWNNPNLHEEYFLDDFIDHYALNVLFHTGIVKGYPDKTYGANQLTTVGDAVTFLIRILGYEDAAEERGGYPEGYMQLARERNLFRNIDKLMEATENIAEQEFVMIQSNALFVRMKTEGKSVFEICSEKQTDYETREITGRIAFQKGERYGTAYLVEEGRRYEIYSDYPMLGNKGMMDEFYGALDGKQVRVLAWVSTEEYAKEYPNKRDLIYLWDIYEME